MCGLYYIIKEISVVYERHIWYSITENCESCHDANFVERVVMMPTLSSLAAPETLVLPVMTKLASWQFLGFSDYITAVPNGKYDRLPIWIYWLLTYSFGGIEQWKWKIHNIDPLWGEPRFSTNRASNVAWVLMISSCYHQYKLGFSWFRHVIININI